MEVTDEPLTRTTMDVNIHSSAAISDTSPKLQTPAAVSSTMIATPRLSNTEVLPLFGGNQEIVQYYLGLKEALEEWRASGKYSWCDPRDTKMRERLEMMNYTPKVIIRTTADDAGVTDELHGFSSKQTALDDGGDGGKSGKKGGKKDSFICGVHGCDQRYTSLASYESHYHTCHNYVCGQCKRSFVSDFLLDVHLEENHDSYFLVLSDRQDMYRCLVESCDQKFRTPDERKDHLVSFHKYPAGFSFHRPIKQKPQKGKKSKRAPKHADENGQSGMEHSSSTSTPPAATPSVSSQMEVDGQASQQQQQQQQQQGAAGKRNKKKKEGKGKKVPQVICFGRGSQRAFQPAGRGRGRHWYQTGDMDVDTTVDIEKVDFGDIADSLADCT